jgi:hypothetical protein
MHFASYVDVIAPITRAHAAMARHPELSGLLRAELEQLKGAR